MKKSIPINNSMSQLLNLEACFSQDYRLLPLFLCGRVWSQVRLVVDGLLSLPAFASPRFRLADQ